MRDTSPTESCLYTLLHASTEHHDQLLRDFVAPLVSQFGAAPELDSYFIARYSEPDWQLRFRILGRPDWISGPVRAEIEKRLPTLAHSGLIRGHEFSEYEREWDRYGGPQGMQLCEQLFMHDTWLCLRWLDLEQQGLLVKSRRELSLLYTERWLDLFNVTSDEREQLYRFAHSWPIKAGEWGPTEIEILDRKFADLEQSLRANLNAMRQADRAVWGNDAVAQTVETAIEQSRPAATELLARHQRGELTSDWVHMLWSLTHMHCNRLGIDSYAESIVRYFGWRLYSPTS